MENECIERIWVVKGDWWGRRYRLCCNGFVLGNCCLVWGCL